MGRGLSSIHMYGTHTSIQATFSTISCLFLFFFFLFLKMELEHGIQGDEELQWYEEGWVTSSIVAFPTFHLVGH